LDLILEGRPLSPDYAEWKSQKRQKEGRWTQITENPKAYVTSKGWYAGVQPIARPLVRAARENLPVSYERYESGWKKRYLTKRTRKVRQEKRPPRRESATKARVAIVGCGNIGLNMHGPAFASIQGVELAGVCDTNYDLALAAGETLGCKAFGELSELVREAKPTLASNCTTEAAHGSTSLYLFEHGVDVFCEKMMAESLETGQRMVKRATELGRVLGINFNWRFQPGVAKIRQIKDAGTLGELCLLRFACHAHVWHHVLDLANFLGGKVVRITAQSRLDPLFEDRRPWRRFADELLYLPGVYANALLETAEGIGISITSSDLWQPNGYLLNLDAVFRRGVISLSGVNEHDVVGILSCDRKGVDLQLDWGQRADDRNYAGTFKRSIEAFMQAYLQEKPPPISGQDGLFAMRMESAVVESAKTGQTVCLA
jgi:predicted dehydrogenase